MHAPIMLCISSTSERTTLRSLSVAATECSGPLVTALESDYYRRSGSAWVSVKGLCYVACDTIGYSQSVESGHLSNGNIMIFDLQVKPRQLEVEIEVV